MPNEVPHNQEEPRVLTPEERGKLDKAEFIREAQWTEHLGEMVGYIAAHKDDFDQLQITAHRYNYSFQAGVNSDDQKVFTFENVANLAEASKHPTKLEFRFYRLDKIAGSYDIAREVPGDVTFGLDKKIGIEIKASFANGATQVAELRAYRDTYPGTAESGYGIHESSNILGIDLVKLIDQFINPVHKALLAAEKGQKFQEKRERTKKENAAERDKLKNDL